MGIERLQNPEHHDIQGWARRAAELDSRIGELEELLARSREYVAVCASGGVSNSDQQFQAEARGLLKEYDELLKAESVLRDHRIVG